MVRARVRVRVRVKGEGEGVTAARVVGHLAPLLVLALLRVELARLGRVGGWSWG